MAKTPIIQGFSKFGPDERRKWVASCTDDPGYVERIIQMHLLKDPGLQKQYNEIAENTLSNYFLPYSVAPNFMVNQKVYAVPMVTEESSVVAAAASAAKFWSERGGFRTRVSSLIKTGQVHLLWNGETQELSSFIQRIIPGFYQATENLTHNMKARGGGITGIRLIDQTQLKAGHFHLEVQFQTGNSMGANFINSCLEQISLYLQQEVERDELSGQLDIVMSILSNYTPGCIVECGVECDTRQFDGIYPDMEGPVFARRFKQAVDIATYDLPRAVTHNKGILNGVDSVVLATGNDFRAVEAAVHAYATRSGTYRGLSEVELAGRHFLFRLEIPLNIGTVGGLTRLHPLADVSFRILGNPDVTELMSVVAAAGLASNFSAIRSLITNGIQKGHMRLHLSNLLNYFHADMQEKFAAERFFQDHPVSHMAVEHFLDDLRAPSSGKEL